MNLAERLKELSREAEKGEPLEAKGLAKNWEEQAIAAANKGYRQVDIGVGIAPSPRDFGNFELAMKILKDQGLWCKLDEKNNRYEVRVAW